MNSEHKKHLEDISEIRNIMERSSTFLSLSGLSGVFPGIFALIGASIAYWYLYVYAYQKSLLETTTIEDLNYEITAVLMIIAVIVLISSLLVGFFFTYRNTKKQGKEIWDKTTYKLLVNLAIPLITGGLFSLILIWHGIEILVSPASLIFYGLALVNASKYTLNDIRYLGISEIIIGLFAAIFTGYGLYFWAFGFGFLHIFYGLMMYVKYERKS